MIKLHRILLAGAVLALASSSTMAGTLGAGTLGGAAISVALQPGTDVLTTSTFTANYLLGGGTGSLSTFPDFSTTGSTTLDLNNVAAFTFTSGGFTFFSSVPPATSSFVLGPNSVTRTIVFNGMVDFNGDLSTSTLTLNFNQSGGIGGSTSANLTLVVPAVVPEPSSVALAGIGLAAAGLFGLRKRLAK